MDLVESNWNLDITAQSALGMNELYDESQVHKPEREGQVPMIQILKVHRKYKREALVAICCLSGALIVV